ncbi:glycosyl transferase [Collibacillus ludicampi]|uniref:Glycosyl transferase n=1 Tax=Collibacillus ludicampi TaxID=2771369 RepID=A0AAV4LD33_9BACL|nr:glycosyltransferase family 2 protein [Collibacillus ludicampi]GIM45661.1 glycosyl transferase [Collibacillus ludicampi]
MNTRGLYVKKIAILLSTYNGEMYLEQMIKSLLNQTYKDFTLIIRDDNSNDRTRQIISKYQQSNKNFVVLFDNSNLGTKSSYEKLLQFAIQKGYEYFMFADQDDVWFPDKVERTLHRMIMMEFQYPKIPLLVHTDLKVSNSHLKVISESFWRYQKLDPRFTDLNRLLTQNVITGCTMMINRRLAELGIPIPEQAIMHDWWLGLVASAFGRIDHITDPTILYRQHAENSVGAKRFNFCYVLKKTSDKVLLSPNIEQARAFYKLYENRLSDDQKKKLNAFVRLKDMNLIKRLFVIISHKFFKIGIIRNLGMILKLSFNYYR